MADLEALKLAAEAATPGPWVVWSSLYEHMDAQLRSADGTVEGVALAEFYRLANGFKNAEFARLANPATILDLISRLEEAEKALEAVAKLDVPRPVGTYWRADCKPTKNDKCAHGVWMYEECGECISDFAHAAHKRLKGGTDEA